MSDFLQRVEQLSPEKRELLNLLLGEKNAELQNSYVAPSTPLVETLASIWGQVLNIDRVGIYDNFFELGGDSIQSIQIIAKANQAGFQLTTGQLFECPTIAELATVFKWEAVLGTLPLTPMQQWFFQQMPALYHWNQAILLQVGQDFNLCVLEEVLQQLLMHHDALRLRFEYRLEQWQQVYTNPEQAVCFSRLDLSDFAESEQASAIEKQIAEFPESFNLSEEPLFKVTFFKLAEDKPNCMLLIIHHLIADAISCQILLQDLQMAYQQLSQGKSIQLPPKTTSFPQWSQLLIKYAQSLELQQELTYWLTQSQTPVLNLPVDYPLGSNTEDSTSIVSISLTVQETHVLLEEIPAIYRTRIDEVLLTALGLTISQWAGVRTLLIDIEFLGREAVFEDVDLSRTLGCFTSVFPMQLHFGEVQTPADALIDIKEQVRRIPKKGIGYGLLRYCCGDAEISEKLSAIPQAEVMFRYLGQFEQVFSESAPFQLVHEYSGLVNGSKGTCSHLLQVTGKVLAGQLQLSWAYHENVHRQMTIEHLAQQFLAVLRSLMQESQSTNKISFTASDFPEAELSQEDLNQLFIPHSLKTEDET